MPHQQLPTKNIPLVDLNLQQQRILPRIQTAIARVLQHGQYIMGPEVFALESALSNFCSAKHVVSCASGTDALILALLAQNIKAGDAVIVPSFTFAATAEVVALLGALPIFCDIYEDTYTLDPLSLEKALQQAKKEGHQVKGIIAVDLFGHPAKYNVINEIAQQNNLFVIADAAQSFGATYKNQPVGTLAAVTCTSFFPAKPLGCYGDGGALFTDDTFLAEKLCSLRIHGKGESKYDNQLVGINGRLDTLQAAILLEKLKIYPAELKKRTEIVSAYNSSLQQYVTIPLIDKDVMSSHANYTIQLPKKVDRNKVSQQLFDLGIANAIYYAKPLHVQPAYQRFYQQCQVDLTVSEKLAGIVLSLPINAYLNESDIAHIAGSLKKLI